MNLTKLTEQYIQGRPSIHDGVKKQLINYSALSRQILREHHLDSRHFDAVLIACRRYYRKSRKLRSREEDILSIVKRSKVEVKNKIMVAVLEKGNVFGTLLELERKARKAGDTFYIIEGSQTVTVVTVRDFSEAFQKEFRHSIVRLNKELALVTIKSPREIETTTGVLGFLISLLSDQGINIIENMSCWTDTLFVIKEEDVGKAVGVLNVP